MTAGQARALEILADYQLPAAGGLLNGSDVFGREAPLGVEIGFGMGHALLAWGAQCPAWNLLGMEIYQSGIGALLLRLDREGIGNVRVIEGAAEWVLATRLPPGSLDEVRIFFPDPWPKKRHHKRRLIQPAFVALLAERLRPGGRLWLATDWAPYAQWMERVLAADARFESACGDPVAARVQTRFEARGARLGHAIRDLVYVRKP
jgi:tRNA (guanine-N7-)-methyltransferase